MYADMIVDKYMFSKLSFSNAKVHVCMCVCVYVYIRVYVYICTPVKSLFHGGRDKFSLEGKMRIMYATWHAYI